MREAELDLSRLRPRAQEPAFEVQRSVVAREPAGLREQEVRVADVLNDDLLVVAERVDRRVLASTRSSPRPQEEPQGGEVGMHIELHTTDGSARSVRGRNDDSVDSSSR